MELFSDSFVWFQFWIPNFRKYLTEKKNKTSCAFLKLYLRIFNNGNRQICLYIYINPLYDMPGLHYSEIYLPSLLAPVDDYLNTLQRKTALIYFWDPSTKNIYKIIGTWWHFKFFTSFPTFHENWGTEKVHAGSDQLSI